MISEQDNSPEAVKGRVRSIQAIFHIERANLQLEFIKGLP